MESKRREQGGRRTSSHSKLMAIPLVVVGVLVAGLMIYGKESRDRDTLERTPPSATGAVRFTDAHRQAAEFISYDQSIVLTAEQQTVMAEGLSSIPAPCCNQYSIATCCCPCNLAKSAWGLSKLLIARQHADAGQVRAAVAEWLQFTNPRGYTGDACFTRGCNRSFEKNGCGGMDDRHVQ